MELPLHRTSFLYGNTKFGTQNPLINYVLILQGEKRKKKKHILNYVVKEKITVSL